MTTQLSTCAVRKSFGEWAFEAGQNGLHPMIYVVGTRGKSTVARRLALLRADRAWFAWALAEATARLPEVGGPVPNPPPHREPDRDRAADMPGVEGADR